MSTASTSSRSTRSCAGAGPFQPNPATSARSGTTYDHITVQSCHGPMPGQSAMARSQRRRRVVFRPARPLRPRGLPLAWRRDNGGNVHAIAMPAHELPTGRHRMPGGDDPHGPAMTPEEFRRHAHALVERMADYMAGVERYPVRARVAPGEVAANLPADPPQAGEPMEAILADVEQVILPGLTHWQHPAFFAYFPANSSPPSVLAEMLTATFGVNAMLWQTSPAATELEGRMMQWLAAMIGLP